MLHTNIFISLVVKFCSTSKYSLSLLLVLELTVQVFRTCINTYCIIRCWINIYLSIYEIKEHGQRNRNMCMWKKQLIEHSCFPIYVKTWKNVKTICHSQTGLTVKYVENFNEQWNIKSSWTAISVSAVIPV